MGNKVAPRFLNRLCEIAKNSNFIKAVYFFGRRNMSERINYYQYQKGAPAPQVGEGLVWLEKC